MEPWKRRIWATAGAVLVIVTLAVAGAWYVATATSGTTATVDVVNPVVIGCGIVALLGAYMAVAALADWPLPGRTREIQNRAELERLERIKSERFVRRNEQLLRLIGDAEQLERNYLASSLEPPDESLLARWSDEARAFIAGIDVKLLPAFDHQRPPADCQIEDRSPQLAEVVGLLRVRTAFLSRLKSGG
jgi:hypothetical protein